MTDPLLIDVSSPSQNIKRDTIKVRAQQYIQAGAKQIQRLNRGGPDQRHGIRPQPFHL